MRRQRRGSLVRQVGQDSNFQPRNLAVAAGSVLLADLVGVREERKEGTVGNQQQEEGHSAGSSGSQVGRRVVAERRGSSGRFMLARSYCWCHL